MSGRRKTRSVRLPGKSSLAVVFLLLALGGAAQERLAPSRIRASASSRISSRPRLGLPVREAIAGYCINAASSDDYAERIESSKGEWSSFNPDLGLRNWKAWDLDPFGSGMKREDLADSFPEAGVLSAIFDECLGWAAEKPYGNLSVVSGPVVLDEEASKGRGARPAAWFVAMCKKTGTPLGWKSIAFLIPAGADLSKAVYEYSEPVNVIEAKTGYNLFCSLPSRIQERVEGMTTYELFCPFHEPEEGLERDAEREGPEVDTDWMDDRINSTQ